MTPDLQNNASGERDFALVVLISGRGSNLGSLIEGINDASLPVRIAAVISNRPDAAGLRRATHAGIETRIVDHQAFSGREGFDAALGLCIDGYAPSLIVLAGFMRVLGAALVERYRGALINIHPSLLPEFPGLHTHARALRAGRSEHGASVHYVTPQLDGGPVIAQARVAVSPADDEDTLAARVLAREHVLLATTVKWIAQRRIALHGDAVLFDGQPLRAPLCI